MDRICHEFLAGAALSGDQYRDIGSRQTLDVAQHLLYGGAVAEDAGDRHLRHGFGQPSILLLEPEEPRGAPDNKLQKVRIGWLLEEIVGARRNRPARMLARFVAGDD